MNLHTIGIDLGKTSFHLVGLSERGEVVVRKRFTRGQVLRFTANRSVQRIGMEACGGSHFLGRAIERQGHDVRLIPAQYVKPYVKTNKNDYIDADAIAEAVGRPTMRFVPIKSDDQLDLQSLHRVREWIGVVPRQLSTGGKPTLLGISKRGNAYLRRMFVQGSRAVLQQQASQSAGLKAWLDPLTARTHRNVACVALANKLARTAWAVLSSGEAYRSPHPAAV